MRASMRVLLKKSMVTCCCRPTWQRPKSVPDWVPSSHTSHTAHTSHTSHTSHTGRLIHHTHTFLRPDITDRRKVKKPAR